MGQPNLKKIISKKEVSSLVSRIISAVGSSLSITDVEGKLLVGSGEESGENRFAIYVSGETIGWVTGDKGATDIAALITYLAERDMERKTLAVDTLEKYKEINLLYNIAEEITACLDLKEVAKLVIEEAHKLIPSTYVSILALDRKSGDLETLASSEEGPDRMAFVRPGEGIRGSIFLTGRAEIVNDVLSDPRYIQGSGPISSMVCAPLKIKDNIIGVISVINETLVNFKAEHLRLLNTLASQAAAAIENARLYDELSNTFFTTVHTLAETIEKRDPYTAGHTRRVMIYSLAIGTELGLPEDSMTNLRLAAILHDIGKIGVRDNVLLKEGKLTDEEFAAIKMHCVYGEEILKHIDMMKEVIPGVKYHHEKFGGGGYPEGLKGDEIVEIARIIGVADAFDAMTSDRPYRKGLSLDIAFAELKKHSGAQFAPEVVAAFFAAHEKGKIEKGS